VHIALQFVLRLVAHAAYVVGDAVAQLVGVRMKLLAFEL
jgi:hypothetical protein